ncbi:MAG: hypothetical protein R3B90_18455 [Planctomycetaceae bacterium]
MIGSLPFQFTRQRLTVLLAMVGWLLTPGGLPCPMTCAAADGPTTASDLRVVTVPADDQANWPAGDWVEIPARLLRDYQDALAVGTSTAMPEATRIHRARYECRLDGDILEGTCEFDIRRDGLRQAPISLSPLGLLLTDVRWPDRPAVWGTAADGGFVVLDHRQADRLAATWRIAGRRASEQLTFDLQLPSATISELVILLPPDRQLSCGEGIVSGPATPAEGGLFQWTIRLGRRTRVALTISRAANAPAALVPQVRESITATVQGAGIDIVSDLEIDAIPTKLLRLRIAEGFRPVAVTVGNDLPLNFRVRPQSGWQELEITLPADLPTRNARMRVKGVQAMTWGGQHPLPIPRVVDANLIDHLLVLHVRQPLQVKQLRRSDYRLLDLRSGSGGVETWSFEGTGPEPEVVAEIGVSEAVVNIDMSGWVDFLSVPSRQVVRVRASGQQGTQYRLSAQMPVEWKVVDVRTTQPADEDGLASFEVVPAENGASQRLTIEFRSALRANESIEFEIESLFVPTDPLQSLPWPFPQWDDVQRFSGRVGFVPPSGYVVASSVNWPTSPQAQAMSTQLRAGCGSGLAGLRAGGTG